MGLFSAGSQAEWVYLRGRRSKQQGKRIRLQGLIDTGNRLKDPLSGQPVCIVEREAVLELLEKAKEQRQIGFRSVGNTNAKILLVRMESLTLWGKSKKQIRDVWIGISDTRISTDGTYRMLVNPDIF
ncbi:MAG: sigma-E processing peptidase SpoIIGA [Sellimonas intestinalis]